MMRIATVAAVGLLLAGVCWLALDAARAEDAGLLDKVRLPKDATLNALPEQILRTTEHLATGEWTPKVATEKARGSAAALYPKIAPAVVVVRPGQGHGSGVFISPDGWLLTNHHVINEANLDADTGARIATVHLGRHDGEQMRLTEAGIPALVYKSSPQKDLALLKLTRMPPGMKTVPYIEGAAASPKPGSVCIAIGHPSAGLLWTVRSGEVAGAGEFPKDLTDFAAEQLDLTGSDRDRLNLALRMVPERRKILLTNCGGTPGDSGGPLVNEEGRLIGITFAGPPEKKRGTSGFLYHVHLDEVKEFIATRPKTPPVLVPSPWPTGVFSSLQDMDGDGKPETVLFGPGPDRPIHGMLIDLKQVSDKDFKAADLADSEKRKGWKFQLAVHITPAGRAFYDTRGDGTIDLILLAAPGEKTASVILRRSGDIWKSETVKGRTLVDPSLFKDKALGERLTAILKKIGS